MTLDYKKMALDFFRIADPSKLQGFIYNFEKKYAGKNVPVYALAEGNCISYNKFQGLLEYLNIENSRLLSSVHQLDKLIQKYGIKHDLVHKIMDDLGQKKPEEIGIIATNRLLTDDECEFANYAIGKILHIGYLTLALDGELKEFSAT